MFESNSNLSPTLSVANSLKAFSSNPIAPSPSKSWPNSSSYCVIDSVHVVLSQFNIPEDDKENISQEEYVEYGSSFTWPIVA